VMNRLSNGQISDPLVSRFGVHLIQMMDRRQNTLSPREQRELARNALKERKAEEAFATWAQDVRARAYVELREPPQ
jgi:peptidyl-prolyl cis-trans isomerase SurA